MLGSGNHMVYKWIMLMTHEVDCSVWTFTRFSCRL